MSFREPTHWVGSGQRGPWLGCCRTLPMPLKTRPRRSTRKRQPAGSWDGLIPPWRSLAARPDAFTPEPVHLADQRLLMSASAQRNGEVAERAGHIGGEGTRTGRDQPAIKADGLFARPQRFVASAKTAQPDDKVMV